MGFLFEPRLESHIRLTLRYNFAAPHLPPFGSGTRDLLDKSGETAGRKCRGQHGDVLELADRHDLGSCAERREGSIPSVPTKQT
jgi:hypothetical protein